MNQITKQTLILILIISLFSCKDVKREQNTHEDAQIPIALQDDKNYEISSISKIRSNDIVEELYNEQLKNDKDLQNLINSIKENKTNQNSASEPFNSYNDKNNQYYSSANLKLYGINDTLLKNKVADLIKNSENKYSLLAYKSKDLLSAINKNNISINDYEHILKITTTISLMEKYQKEQLPSTKSLLKIIEEQNKIINTLKKQTNIQ